VISRYILTVKMKKILDARGHNLICKICRCPLIAGLSRKEAEKRGDLELMGDEIESKQQRKGKCKFYHAKCYDDSMYDVPNGDDDDEDFFACWRPDHELTMSMDKGNLLDFGLIKRFKKLFKRGK